MATITDPDLTPETAASIIYPNSERDRIELAKRIHVACLTNDIPCNKWISIRRIVRRETTEYLTEKLTHPEGRARDAFERLWAVMSEKLPGCDLRYEDQVQEGLLPLFGRSAFIAWAVDERLSLPDSLRLEAKHAELSKQLTQFDDRTARVFLRYWAQFEMYESDDGMTKKGYSKTSLGTCSVGSKYFKIAKTELTRLGLLELGPGGIGARLTIDGRNVTPEQIVACLGPFDGHGKGHERSWLESGCRRRRVQMPSETPRETKKVEW